MEKDAGNLIGISIGGGSPFCPCLYVVQVFDGTPAAVDAKLQAGDEVTGVDKVSCKAKTKSQVAKMIQSTKVCFGVHPSVTPGKISRVQSNQ